MTSPTPPPDLDPAALEAAAKLVRTKFAGSPWTCEMLAQTAITAYLTASRAEMDAMANDDCRELSAPHPQESGDGWIEEVAAAMFESNPVFTNTKGQKRWTWEMIGEDQKEYWRGLACVASRHAPKAQVADGMILVETQALRNLMNGLRGPFASRYDLAQLVEAMLPASPSPDKGEWQVADRWKSIESAPEDGTWILVCQYTLGLGNPLPAIA